MRLVATSGGQTLSFPLRQGSTLIGRHSSCHICIPANTISRRHCQCYVDGMNVTLRDLGSSHGTFVNNQRIERAELHNGDVILLGSFELRFDTEGAAPAYAHGTRAAEDIVVTAQPAGMGGQAGPPPTAPLGTPGGPQPFPQEPPPPAPTDFPEKPSGDETPADQSFVPAPYVPRQETVLGAADQPQLVVREGRWFLRDPRTGREVEIAPTGGAGAVAAPPTALRRPNTRLLVTVIAIAAIVVITFAAVILKGKPRPQTGPTTSNAEWVKIVDTGIDEFKAGKYAEAIARFDLASSKRRDLEPARLLNQYTLLRQAAGDDFRKLNKSEALRYLESIENTPCPSDKAIAFAREQRDWIDKEYVAVGLYDALYTKYQGAGDSEEVLIELLPALQQIPQDRWAGKPAKELYATIRNTIATGRLSRAEREKAQRKWAEAITRYNDALSFIESAATKAQVQTRIEECRRYAIEEELVREAQRAIGSKNYAAAREPLRRIKAGIYYDTAIRLLANIDRMEAAEAREALRQRINALYESGADPQVLEDFINKNKLDEFRHVIEKAKRVIALLAEGKKAEEEKQYREAEDKYGEAAGVEGDANNDYNRRSKRMLEAIKARYPEIAAEFAANGYRKLDKDPLGARKDFDEALKYDANTQRAKDGLALMERRARLLYTEARGYLTSRPPKPDTARMTFERARDCAAPGSNLHQLIMQELEKLRK